MRVVVGRIGKPHGLRGQVTIEVRTDEPEERFAPGAVLLSDGLFPALTVASIHWHSGRLLVSFVGCEDRGDAERLRGTILEVERSADHRPQDPDEFYDSALMGCSVVTLDGSEVGIVSEVVHLPSQELLSVTTPSGGEVLIPFVSSIVPTVDISTRIITVNPPAGLLDEVSGVPDEGEAVVDAD